MARAARILAAAAAMLALCAPAGAASLEYQVKAAYLFKIIPFVDWPASAQALAAGPLRVCIAGADPFESDIDRIARGQTVGDRSIEVARLRIGDDPAQCHVLFVGRGDPRDIAALMAAVETSPVLTVTDSGAPQSGIIGFAIDQNHVRFDIDDAAAARAGLTISSKLLGIARSVKPRSPAP